MLSNAIITKLNTELKNYIPEYTIITSDTEGCFLIINKNKIIGKIEYSIIIQHYNDEYSDNDSDMKDYTCSLYTYNPNTHLFFVKKHFTITSIDIYKEYQEIEQRDDFGYYDDNFSDGYSEIDTNDLIEYLTK